ncbi:MAG: hypothetical protein AAGI37_07240 [Planctomycetota bacterium]
MAASKRKRNTVLFALAITMITVIALGNYLTRAKRDFDSLQDFSNAWLHTPVEDRHVLLDWLLGESASRSTTYPIEQTKLYGLKREEVEQYLGKDPAPIYMNDKWMIFYDVGSIESDITGFFIPGFSKWDTLEIQYDDDGNILKISTIS